MSFGLSSVHPFFTRMLNRLTRFPGWEKEAGKDLDCTSGAVSEISKTVGLPRINQTVSRCLPMTTKLQSPWTEYRGHLKTKQAGNVIIAYDRKMKEFAIKEVKGCRRDWLLRLKAISHPNIVRFVASFYHKGSIYLVGDLMSTSLAEVLSVSKLPLEEVATVCKGVVTGLSCLHKDLMMTHGTLNGENILLSKSGDVKIGKPLPLIC
jgi:serine/threonine protein kinase